MREALILNLQAPSVADCKLEDLLNVDILVSIEYPNEVLPDEFSDI